MIKSVRLIAGDTDADKVKKEIMNIENIERLIGQKSFQYWETA